MEQQQKRTHLHQWNFCRLDRCGPIYILILTGEGDHRFNPSSLDDILAALAVVEQSPEAGALVTTNEGKYFSNGLDLKLVQNSGSLSSLGLILNKFHGLLSVIMKLGIPTIAAVCGHAAAGGFILALAHDYRFVKNGRAVLYMSELDHGFNIPMSLMSVIRSKLLPASLREVVLKARKATAPEAFEYGFVDGFYDDSAKTVEVAIGEAEKLASSKWKRVTYANLRAVAFPGVIEELEAKRDHPYVWPKG